MSGILDGIQTPCGTNLEGTSAQLFLTLINTLMAAQCSLGTKDYYPASSTNNLQDGDEFDFIVVGAGSSGSVVASRLSENPQWKTLLLEAGDYPSVASEVPSLFFEPQGTAEDWQYKTEKSDLSCKGFIGGQCKWPRGKLLGGSSSINGMMHVRGSARDYDDWEKLGNAGWSYDELEKHFKTMENLQSSVLQGTKIYGNGGYQNLSWYDNEEPISKSIVEGVNKLGHPVGSTLEIDPRNPLGYYQILMAIEQGVRQNAAKSFLGHTKNKGNVILATKAFVKRVIIDKDSRQATGIEVQIADQTKTFFAKKEVILSAGALNSPQILLHSGIGPKADLEEIGITVAKDLPGVGRNLQDHVVVPLYYRIKENAFSKISKSHLLENLYSYFKAREGPLGTIFLTNLNGFINTKQDSQYPNVQIVHIGFRKNDRFLLPQVCEALGYNEEIAKELLKNVEEEPLVFIEPMVLNPKSTGNIKLKSKDVFEAAKFYSGYFTDPDNEDMKLTLESIRFVQKLMETPSLKQHNPRLIKVPLPACKSFSDTNEYWKCYVQHVATTLYHPVGTAKMGPTSDKTAVVDDRLRVYGIGKLRVIDASIMPKLTSGNTNAPCLVIGHKGGEMILEDWKDQEGLVCDEL